MGARSSSPVLVLLLAALVGCGSSSSGGAVVADGCKADNDCKGARICQSGQCVDAPVGAGGAAGVAGTTGASAGGTIGGMSAVGGGSNGGTTASGGTSIGGTTAHGGAATGGTSGAAGTTGSGGASMGGSSSIDPCFSCFAAACPSQAAKCSADPACVKCGGYYFEGTDPPPECVDSATINSIASDIQGIQSCGCACDSVCAGISSFVTCSGAGGTGGGSSCQSCIDATCGSASTACHDDPACAAVIKCVQTDVQQGMTPDCAVSNCVGTSSAANDLYTCVANNCASNCSVMQGFPCP